MARAFILNETDNVATLIDPAKNGDPVLLVGQGSGTVRVAGEIPFGHKLAARKIGKGESIVKYGKVIGQATKDIVVGEHVHVHNVEALRARGDKKAVS
jgi:altronate dehydratase small subunit